MPYPFSDASEIFGALSADLGPIGDELPHLMPTGDEFKGSAADAVEAQISAHTVFLRSQSEIAAAFAAVCAAQAPADAALMTAPTPKDIGEQQAKLTAAQAKANAGDPLARLKQRREKARLDEMVAERESALSAHGSSSGTTAAEASGITVPTAPTTGGGVCTPGGGNNTPADDPGDGSGEDAPSDETPTDTPLPGDAPSTASTDVSGAGGTTPSVSDTAASTSLTADSGTGTPVSAQPALAQQVPAQPQMAPMQGQPQGGAGGGGVPAGGAAPAGTGIPRGSMLGGAVRDRNGKKDRDKDREPVSPSNLDSLIGVAAGAGAGVGASTIGGIDRGSSVSGVTTERTITGAGATQGTALSGNTTPPPNNPNGLGAGATARGMGPMGGMGGMGAGGGMGSGTTVARPDIKAAPESLAQQQERESVRGGVVGRDTSTDPTKEDDGGRKK